MSAGDTPAVDRRSRRRRTTNLLVKIRGREYPFGTLIRRITELSPHTYTCTCFYVSRHRCVITLIDRPVEWLLPHKPTLARKSIIGKQEATFSVTSYRNGSIGYV